MFIKTNYYFDPTNLACKNIVGGVKEGDTLTISVYSLKTEREIDKLSLFPPLKEEFDFPNVTLHLVLAKDGQEKSYYPMTKFEHGWRISLKIHKIGLYFYSFFIEKKGFIMQSERGIGYYSPVFAKEFSLTVSSKDYKTPDWFKGGVMYQIFPDRFCKVGTMPDINGRIQRNDWGGLPSYKPNEFGKVLNNDFFGGNLKGIQSKLPYLKDLGVTVLYLNPIFEAASNHRYDTSNYMNIDPYLGTKSDFENLVLEAKKYGISVILDGVFNHTGDDSVYFNKYGKYDSLGAYQSKDSPYYSWYSFQEFPKKYSSWWGIDILPEINERSEDYQEFIFGEKGVLKNWLRSGIGGYRLDVADELPDFFLKKLRKSVKEENPNAIIIGEVWEDASEKIAYSQRREYLLGDELDSVMNYPLKDGIISYLLSGNAFALLDVIRNLIDHYPKETLDCLMNVLGTHDTARILTVLAEKQCYSKDEMASENAILTINERKMAINRLKMAVVLQYTMPGIPCVFYGDENGMEGFGDPFCRRCFDWKNLNEELINFYKKLGEIRKRHADLFSKGKFETVFSEEGLIIYKRISDQNEIYVFTNNSSKKYELNLNGNFIELISEKLVKNKFTVNEFSFGIFYKNQEKKPLNA